MNPSTPPVVTVNTTNPDGRNSTIVRWHHTVEDATRFRAVVSADRSGVRVHTTYQHEVPPAWLAAAHAAWQRLRVDPAADVSGLATHRNSVVSNGPLVPVHQAEGVDRG